MLRDQNRIFGRSKPLNTFADVRLLSTAINVTVIAVAEDLCPNLPKYLSQRPGSRRARLRESSRTISGYGHRAHTVPTESDRRPDGK